MSPTTGTWPHRRTAVAVATKVKAGTRILLFGAKFKQEMTSSKPRVALEVRTPETGSDSKFD
jgi:hypothetical protein